MCFVTLSRTQKAESMILQVLLGTKYNWAEATGRRPTHKQAIHPKALIVSWANAAATVVTSSL